MYTVGVVEAKVFNIYASEMEGSSELHLHQTVQDLVHNGEPTERYGLQPDGQMHK